MYFLLIFRPFSCKNILSNFLGSWLCSLSCEYLWKTTLKKVPNKSKAFYSKSLRSEKQYQSIKWFLLCANRTRHHPKSCFIFTGGCFLTIFGKSQNDHILASGTKTKKRLFAFWYKKYYVWIIHFLSYHLDQITDLLALQSKIQNLNEKSVLDKLFLKWSFFHAHEDRLG